MQSPTGKQCDSPSAPKPAPDSDADLRNVAADLRFPRSGKEHFPVAVKFDGAELNVLAINYDWASSEVPALSRRPLAERSLPSKEEVQESLYAPDDAMKAIRTWSRYACHDIRVVTRTPDGELLYLATRRLEPGAHSNVSSARTDGRISHSAPINGCWWPPGGRVSVPCPGSTLEAKGFDEIDSVMLKLNREVGVTPSDVMRVHLLGIGETNFSTEMEYTYRGHGTESYEFTVPVRMDAPQCTVNKNFVVEVSPDAVLTLASLTSARWIDKRTYTEHRDQFCAYEQKFLDALFGVHSSGASDPADRASR